VWIAEHGSTFIFYDWAMQASGLTPVLAAHSFQLTVSACDIPLCTLDDQKDTEARHRETVCEMDGFNLHADWSM
jgi:hypothetical protein